ncbi:unnamed protein product [Fraxinus pennsylvanica]|uniref:NPR1/NIM1-like C-terminal domain-containing protein n=1 Tax=Fraxinus pennsylvanica TaxID=56036 RepID=A0AAD2E9C4_9LAMI|nr:unnamed protein product [Fraxinus pennsylvanica]
MARVLFPVEAKFSMQIAEADSTAQFFGLYHQKALAKGQCFFSNCSKVLDELLVDEKVSTLLLDNGTPEEWRMKRKRYTELKDDLMKEFDKVMSAKKWNH